jgi:hypothetical protein
VKKRAVRTLEEKGERGNHVGVENAGRWGWACNWTRNEAEFLMAWTTYNDYICKNVTIS